MNFQKLLLCICRTTRVRICEATARIATARACEVLHIKSRVAKQVQCEVRGSLYIFTPPKKVTWSVRASPRADIPNSKAKKGLILPSNLSLFCPRITTRIPPLPQLSSNGFVCGGVPHLGPPCKRKSCSWYVSRVLRRANPPHQRSDTTQRDGERWREMGWSKETQTR